MSIKGRVSVIYLIVAVIAAAGAGAMIWRQLRLTKQGEAPAAKLGAGPEREAPPPPAVQTTERVFVVKEANKQGFTATETGGTDKKELQVFIMPSAVVRKHGIDEIAPGAALIAKKYLLFGNGMGIIEADVYETLSAAGDKKE